MTVSPSDLNILLCPPSPGSHKEAVEHRQAGHIILLLIVSILFVFQPSQINLSYSSHQAPALAFQVLIFFLEIS